MKDLTVSMLIEKPIVSFSGKQVTLPLDIQKKIDIYWDELLQSGKAYKRGEVFTVTKKEKFESHIEVLVEKTDYAHYLYSQNVGNLGRYDVCIIHVVALVETSDGKTIFGRMGKQTSQAGIYQLCGGGIDNYDLRGDVFDLDHNIRKELKEELGIDTEEKQRIKSLGLAYLKENGLTGKMTVVYRMILNEASSDFMRRYDDFVLRLQKNGEHPEFDEIIVLDKDKRDFSQFFNQKDIKLDEYMKPLFEFLGKELL